MCFEDAERVFLGMLINLLNKHQQRFNQANLELQEWWFWVEMVEIWALRGLPYKIWCGVGER